MAEEPSGAGPDDETDESIEDDRFASIASAEDVADDDPDDRWGWTAGEDRSVPTDGSIPVDLDDEREEGDDDRDEYAPEPNSTRIEPGTPDAENVLFVVLGAIAMILVILRLATIFVGV